MANILVSPLDHVNVILLLAFEMDPFARFSPLILESKLHD